MKLLKRFGKSLWTPDVVYEQSSAVHAHTGARIDAPPEVLSVREMPWWLIKCMFT